MNWHNFFVGLVGLVVLVAGFAVGLVILGRRADEAIARAIRESDDEFKREKQ